jgi:hypothetical protein
MHINRKAQDLSGAPSNSMTYGTVVHLPTSSPGRPEIVMSSRAWDSASELVYVQIDAPVSQPGHGRRNFAGELSQFDKYTGIDL